MNGAWRAYGAEFVGTGWMVAVGTGSVALGGSLLVISLSFGLAVTLAILALRCVRGSHQSGRVHRFRADGASAA